MQGIRPTQSPKWKFYIRRIFHLKAKVPAENNVEQAEGDQGYTPVVDEILRDDMLEEVESIQRSIDQQIDSELWVDKETAGLLEHDIVS